MTFFAALACSAAFLHVNAAGHSDSESPFGCSKQFYVTGSLLYWQALEQTMDYAFISQPGSSLANDGTFRYLTDNWNAGFKVGGGCRIPSSDYEVALNYLHYNTRAKDSVSVGSGANIYSGWTAPFANLTGAQFAKGDWKIDLNMAALEMAARFNPVADLGLRPHAGLIFASLNQHLHIALSGGVTRGMPRTVLDNSNYLTNDFWGIGVRTGCDGVWRLGQGFSIYGDAAVSVLYGEFNIKQDEIVLLEGLMPRSVYDFQTRFPLPRTIAEVGAGVQWVQDFDQTRIQVKLGWENMVFFGQNQLKRFTNSIDPASTVTTHGDLMTQGLTFSALFGF